MREQTVGKISPYHLSLASMRSSSSWGPGHFEALAWRVHHLGWHLTARWLEVQDTLILRMASSPWWLAFDSMVIPLPIETLIMIGGIFVGPFSLPGRATGQSLLPWQQRCRLSFGLHLLAHPGHSLGSLALVPIGADTACLCNIGYFSISFFNEKN